MRIWRIFPARFRNSAFTGIEGLYAAGRWNHLGTPMVYTATSRALAALEFFVNLEPNQAPNDLLIAEATLPNDLVARFDPATLPKNWRQLNNLPCRDIGSAWATSNRSVALEAPSAIVEGDTNVLLNPNLPDFKQVQIAEPKPFRYDEHMFR